MAIENGVQNAELGYLLFPFESYSNLAGKPLVGGHMEIFEAGTDTKYISYQNWDGAENPFRIPIPNDGRITVLADPTKTFDCYLYDSYNNLVCSRLNVQANVPGNISIKGADTIIKNTDGTLDVSLRTLGNNIREYTVNTHNKILDVQSPLYFVENSNTATVIGFSGDEYVSSSTYNTDITNINNNITALSADVTGKMDVDKLEFENNKITGYDGSAFAGGGSVDPSEFVPWSASGAFQQSGNYYSASNPSGFINSDAISSMATTGFVADVSAEITALIPTAVTGDYLTKASADTLYYPLNSNPSGYLTAHQDLSQYAKTEDLTAYQEKGDYYSASNPSGFLTKSSADELYAPTGDYATHDDLTAYQPSGNYADATALDGKVDTSSFTAFSSTTNEHIEYLSAALSGSYELSAGEGIDITDYPNEQKTVISVTAQGGDPEVEQVVKEYSAAGTWLTAHQDISNLMPKSESANFYPMTGNPSGFLTESYEPEFAYHDTAISSIDNSAVYDTSAHARINTLSNRITALSSDKLDATAFDPNAFYPSGNPSGFITGVDLTPYQTVEGMTAYQAAGDYYSASNPSGFISTVPDTYLQNTDLTIVDNKVTEISGVPLSAGDELPATVMDTSGLEYNSQGYINGYNGSAVATIDQERQWFTHDDTLCHISNSAQYALGVNMSAISADLARMMGVDETVLLDRGTDDLTAPNTAQLSEPFSAFEKIEIWSVWNPWPTNVPQATYYPGTATNGSYMVWDNSQYMRAGYGKWAVNGTTFQLVSASQTTNWPTFDSPQTGLGGIRKIVGIGRKN